MNPTEPWQAHAFFAAGWMRLRWKSSGARLAKAERRYLLANSRFLKSSYHYFEPAMYSASNAVNRSHDAAWEWAAKVIY